MQKNGQSLCNPQQWHKNWRVPYLRQDRAYDIRRVRSYSRPRAVAGRSGLYIMFCTEEETHSLVMVVPGAIISPVGWAVQSLSG